jgi:hypothetical protein
VDVNCGWLVVRRDTLLVEARFRLIEGGGVGLTMAGRLTRLTTLLLGDRGYWAW